MNRKLVVNQHDNYKILYLGFISGGDAAKETGRASTRLKRNIIKKLNECGEFDEVDGFKRWNGEEHTIEFTQEEYEKLEQYLEKFEYKTIFADKVADMFDWFSSAEKE